MKHKLYKKVFTGIAICFLGTAFAQKFDKKFTENFKVNKDVEIVINASNSDINVTTWSKNEVQVEAYIEIEGFSKREAEEYFEKWNFEALGNNKKVSITSKGGNFSQLKNDIVFFDNMNFNMVIPEIEMPDFDAIEIPDMNFDFDFDSLDSIEEKMVKEGKYTFEYHNDDEHIIIKSKKEWDKFKKSKKYLVIKKDLKKTGLRVKKDLENSRKQMKSINKQQIKNALEEARLQIKNIDTEQIRVGLLKAKEVLKNMNFSFRGKTNDLTINGKKVKIKKRIEIKVPKGATFNLNTRHCKVILPDTVASGNVEYGTFKANDLLGGRLTVAYSPVTINSLNACTLFLNNVTDAKIASVTNTIISNNSSNIELLKIYNNVSILDKFGKLKVDSFSDNFGEFTLNLSNSEAVLSFGNVPSKITYNVNKVNLNNLRSKDFKNLETTKNLLKVKGEYSSIIIK